MDKLKIETAVENKAKELRTACNDALFVRLLELDVRGEMVGAQNDLDWFSGRFKGLQIVLKNLDAGYLDNDGEERVIERIKEI